MGLHRVLLLPVFAGAAVLRIFRLGAESLWLDEIFSADYVAARNLMGVLGDSFRVDCHPFLYHAVLDICTYASGYGEAAVRATSAVAGFLTVVATYALARAAFRSCWTALLAALFAAISPLLIRYSQEARMYAMMTLFWPLLLHALLRLLRTGAGLRNSSYVVLAYAAFAYSHGIAGLLAAPVVAATCACVFVRALHARDRTATLRTAAIPAACALVFLPWVIRMLSIPATSQHMGPLGLRELPQLACELFYDCLPTVSRPLLLLAAAVSCLPVLLTALPGTRKLLPVQSLTLLLGSCAIVLFTQAVLARARPVYQPRNMVFLATPLLICAAAGLAAWFRAAVGLRNPLSRIASIAAATALTVLFTAATVRATWSHVRDGYDKEPWRELVPFVARQLGQDDLCAFYAGFTQRSWAHYRRGPPREARGAPMPPNEFMIPRTHDRDVFSRELGILLGAARSLRPGGAVWVFYSRVPDPEKVDLPLRSLGLVGEDVWTRKILVKRYQQTI